MNTSQLACFLAVAETLNFAMAAERLHVTQPAVTQQIRALEDELGFRLFNRTTRTVELTRAGLLFINDAKSVLDTLERAKKRGGESFEDTRVPLRIGCHAHHEIELFPALLRELRQSFPEIYPVFRVVPFRHLYQQLIEDDLDVVVGFREGGLKKYVNYRELAKIPITAMLPQEHPLSGYELLEPSQLRGEKLVVGEPWSCPEQMRAAQHELVEDRSALDIYLSDSGEGEAALAEAGFGIAIVPELAPSSQPGMRRIPIRGLEPMSYGVYYKSLAGKPELRQLIELAKRAFALASAPGDGI